LVQALGLSSPEELFDIHFFREDPVPFYKFAKQVRSSSQSVCVVLCQRTKQQHVGIVDLTAGGEHLLFRRTSSSSSSSSLYARNHNNQLYFPGGGGDTADPPVKVTPSDTHKLLALLDEKKMLLRIYSQNIDGACTEYI
jgi:NAD-dependent SIR2 family protein deacetylase